MNEFLHGYTHLLADPAHLAVELTFNILIDGLLLGLLWPLIRRRFRREIDAEHRVIDAEHGITHPPRKVRLHAVGRIDAPYIPAARTPEPPAPATPAPYDYAASGF